MKLNLILLNFEYLSSNESVKRLTCWVWSSQRQLKFVDSLFIVLL